MFSDILTSIVRTIPFMMMQPTSLARMFELRSDPTFLCNNFSFRRYGFNCRKTAFKKSIFYGMYIPNPITSQKTLVSYFIHYSKDGNESFPEKKL